MEYVFLIQAIKSQVVSAYTEGKSPQNYHHFKDQMLSCPLQPQGDRKKLQRWCKTALLLETCSSVQRPHSLFTTSNLLFLEWPLKRSETLFKGLLLEAHTSLHLLKAPISWQHLWAGWGIMPHTALCLDPGRVPCSLLQSQMHTTRHPRWERKHTVDPSSWQWSHGKMTFSLPGSHHSHCPLQMLLWREGLCSQVPCLHGVLVVKDLRALKLILYITYSGILSTTHFKAERGTKQAQSGTPITLQVSGSETTNTTSNPDHTKGLWGHKWFHLYLGQHSDVTSETKRAIACGMLRSIQHVHWTQGIWAVFYSTLGCFLPGLPAHLPDSCLTWAVAFGI